MLDARGQITWRSDGWHYLDAAADRPLVAVELERAAHPLAAPDTAADVWAARWSARAADGQQTGGRLVFEEQLTAQDALARLPLAAHHPRDCWYVLRGANLSTARGLMAAAAPGIAFRAVVICAPPTSRASSTSRAARQPLTGTFDRIRAAARAAPIPWNGDAPNDAQTIAHGPWCVFDADMRSDPSHQHGLMRPDGSLRC